MATQGGLYPADQNPDGTWNIRGVPIFGELAKGARGNEEALGREWMESAITKARQRATEKYVAPLHTRHHPNSPHATNQAERAGFLMPTHVGRMVYEGREIDALFADYLNVPPEVFEQFKRAELPYVSVEFKNGTPEIWSAALLSDEVPFFRFPIQTIGEETPHAVEAGAISIAPKGSTQPAVAMFDAGQATSVLWKFNGGTDVTTNTNDIEQRMSALEGKLDSALEKLSALISGAHSADESEEVQGEQGDETEQGPVSLSAGAQQTLEAIVEAGEAATETETVTTKAEEAQPDVALMARLAALESKQEQRDRKDEQADRLSAAVATLRGEGYYISDATQGRLATFAAMGQEALDVALEQHREANQPDPPRNVEGMENARASDPDEVAAYGADRDQLEQARQFSAQYDEIKALHPQHAGTRESFIKAAMSAAGA